MSTSFRLNFMLIARCLAKMVSLTHSFQIRFLEWIYIKFHYYFTEVCSWWTYQQYFGIGSDNGLVQVRRQAIVCTNDGRSSYLNNLDPDIITVNLQTIFYCQLNAPEQTTVEFRSNIMVLSLSNKISFKIATPKWWPFTLGPNVLTSVNRLVFLRAAT